MARIIINTSSKFIKIDHLNRARVSADICFVNRDLMLKFIKQGFDIQDFLSRNPGIKVNYYDPRNIDMLDINI